MADAMDGEGTLEDVDKGEGADVKRWLEEIKLADKRDKDWVNSVNSTLKVYNGDNFRDNEHTKRKETFNILWSNVETKRPALYNSVPRPDIRRRFRDPSPIGKAVAELLERSLSFTMEEDFDDEMIAAVNDILLPGRAVTRVKYVPTLSEEEVDEMGNVIQEAQVDYQEIQYEQVQWDDFRMGPGRTWKEVPWEAFRHKMIKSEFIENFGEDLVEKVTFDASAGSQSDDLNKDDNTERTIFKKTTVWEIWNKEDRTVIFISPSYKDKPLKEVDDPLSLKNFWPNPCPLYAIESPTSMVPTCEYTMYETLARELELMTNRIAKIIDGLRLRGIYDSTMSEIEKLFDEQDNGFIPAEGVARLMEGGGLENAIWMLPIKEMAEVLQYLYQRREALVQEIYEITGISDIQRGNTNPNETLGAQQIKANFGSQRLQRQQRSVQKYIKETLKIAAELIAENFSPDMLGQMTGMKFPSGEEKAAAQQAINFAQNSGAEPDPQAMQVMEVPSWDEIMEILTSDVAREFSIDIETDSTISATQEQDEQAVTNLLTGIVQFIEGMGPAVTQGILPLDAAKKMLMSAVRRFKLGREVEDALEEIGQGQQDDPNAAAQQAEQQKQQIEMQKQQMQMQADQQKMQMEQEVAQKEHQHHQAMNEMERASRQEEAALKREEMQMQLTFKRAEHQMKMQELNQPRNAANG